MKSFVPAAALAACVSMFATPQAAHAGTEDYIGEITMVGFNWCPRNTLPANGQLLPIAQFQSLFSLYGTFYGGDGRTTFGLPDLRGRVPVAFGTSPGLSTYPIGARVGTETRTLNTLNLPSHNHTAVSEATTNVHATTSLNDTQVPAGNRFGELPAGKGYASTGDLTDTMLAGTATTTVTTTTLNTGGSQAFDIRQPTVAINFCVTTQGIYPSRP